MRSCVVIERWVASSVGVADRAVTGLNSGQNSIPSLPSPHGHVLRGLDYWHVDLRCNARC